MMTEYSTSLPMSDAKNSLAVAETFHISGSIASAATAADNVVAALYFALLFALADADNVAQDTARNVSSTLSESKLGDPASNDGTGISVASVMVTQGGILTRISLPKGPSTLPLMSALFPQSLNVFIKLVKPWESCAFKCFLLHRVLPVRFDSRIETSSGSLWL